MVHEAEVYRQDDLRKKQVVELRNNLEGLIYTTSKSLEEYGGYFQPQDYDSILKVLEDAQRVLDIHPNDYEQLRNHYQQLEQSSYKIAEAMYSFSSQTEIQHYSDSTEYAKVQGFSDTREKE
jgi:molecular chaperone DnaK